MSSGVSLTSLLLFSHLAPSTLPPTSRPPPCPCERVQRSSPPLVSEWVGRPSGAGGQLTVARRQRARGGAGAVAASERRDQSQQGEEQVRGVVVLREPGLLAAPVAHVLKHPRQRRPRLLDARRAQQPAEPRCKEARAQAPPWTCCSPSAGQLRIVLGRYAGGCERWSYGRRGERPLPPCLRAPQRRSSCRPRPSFRTRARHGWRPRWMDDAGPVVARRCTLPAVATRPLHPAPTAAAVSVGRRRPSPPLRARHQASSVPTAPPRRAGRRRGRGPCPRRLAQSRSTEEQERRWAMS
jgi:hypothetical protein